MLPVTTPHVGFADAANAQRLARESNEYAARLAGDHRGRFGSFAMLPIHDAGAALREIEYTLFGSDYPYRTGEDHVNGLAAYGFSAAELRAIGRGNAARLMPRWVA